MQRDESSANPEKQVGHDDANASPGTGTSGPGDPGYDGQSQVNVVGGEAEIDLEDKARQMEMDPSADPAMQPGSNLDNDPDDQAAG